MKSSERVSRAISFGKPDRIPFCGYNGLAPLRSDVLPLPPLTPNSWQPPLDKSPPHYPHVHRSQIRSGMYKWNAEGWNPKPQKDWYTLPRTEIDEWGVIWNGSTIKTMGEPLDPALLEWDMLDSYSIPNGKNPDRYATARKLARIVPEKSKFRMGVMTNFVFEVSHFVRGWDNYLRDLFKYPNELQKLIKKIMQFYYDCADQLFAMKAKAIFTTDDWGSQKNILISPAMFDKFYAEPYKAFIKYCHDHGAYFILHSCGKINKLIPKFIELGVDALQLDAPHMVGLDEASGFAGKMCFFDGIDIQKIYPFAGPKEIEEEFKRMAIKIGAKDGGLVAIDYFNANSALNVPWKTIKAFEKAVKKYGKYRTDGYLALLSSQNEQ